MDKRESVFRILSLDGGGAKGFYTLGILHQVEATLGGPLHKEFDLIYGTSTGAIIAALLSLGKSVDEIHSFYRMHVPEIMRAKYPFQKSRNLRRLGVEVFGNTRFEDMKTRVGIVTTKWKIEEPMIFKNKEDFTYSRQATFSPGFGCTIAEAVEASCSAYPYFNRKKITVFNGEEIELIDGGFCANNPTLYALSDAIVALGYEMKDCRVLSLGCGQFPEPKRNIIRRIQGKFCPAVLLQKTLEANRVSMEQMRMRLCKEVPTIRISEEFSKSDLAADLFEYDREKFGLLRQEGMKSFGKFEPDFERLFLNGK